MMEQCQTRDAESGKYDKPSQGKLQKRMGMSSIGRQSAPPMTQLTRTFYERDPREVGRDLLGKLLVRGEGRRVLAGRIVEVEAYMGDDDPAAHSAVGRTRRNEVLFGPAGHAYVYLIYGNHYCVNVSCMPEGDAGCVLLRALEPVSGVEEMARARGIELPEEPRIPTLRNIAGGPGRLAEALGITRPRDNGKDLTLPGADLAIMDDGFRPERIAATPRIGITKAMDHEFRYVIARNAFVSGTRSVK